MINALSRRKPGIQRATEHVRGYIDSHSLKPGNALPSIRSFSGHAGVSYVTMCKALKALARTGELSVGSDKSYAVKNRSLDIDTSSECSSDMSFIELRPWRRAMKRVTDDILNCVYAPGAELPTIKELQGRYGVSFRTMRKALQQLARDGILENLTSGAFAVPGFSARTWKPRIVCTVQSIDSYTMAFGQNDEAFFRELELQCERAHIKLDVYLVHAIIDILDHRLRHKSTGRICDTADLAKADDHSVLGYVHIIPWHPENTDRRIVIDLAPLKKPIAVIDETGRLELPADIDNKPWIRRLSIGLSAEPAPMVARHLAVLGHTRIAYLSVDHQHAWSVQRLRGIESAFLKTAHDGAVVPFIAKTSDIYLEGLKHADLSGLEKFYSSWRETLNASFQHEIDYAMERIRIEAGSRAEHRMNLLPLMEEALADPGITAWVMANDQTAATAMSFLAERKKRVPADISVISFDDSIAALRSNISSYNFNVPAIASSVLGFCLGRKPYSDVTRSILGFIVDRGSTGRVKLP